MSDLNESKKVMSYLIGQNLSRVLPQMLPGLTADDVVAEMLGRGLVDAMRQHLDESIVNDRAEEHQRAFLTMLQERENSRGQKNLELGRLYMAENAKRPGVTTTDSGLQYEVLEPGTGASYDPAVHGEAPTAEVMY
ncbi:MAG: FKBP-type peptidyl-prolyl cis-trans isomerase N-terminal domain-containing protein, partial [Akkermansia sp.]